MHGVNVQVSGQLTRRLWVVGEFDGSQGPDCSGCEPTYRDFAGLGGLRSAWQPTPHVSPFVQFLAGGLHSTAQAYDEVLCCGLGTAFQENYSFNYFALQPGGGVTVMVTPRFGLRAQADVQFATLGEGMSIFPRVAAGAVFRLGRMR